MVRGLLASWGLAAEQGPLELAVSELVSNAIIHGDGLIDVRLAVAGDCIRLEVADQGGGHTAPRRSRRQASEFVGGWGLDLVERLSDAWGHSRDGGRTLVWMERRTGGASPGGDGP